MTEVTVGGRSLAPLAAEETGMEDIGFSPLRAPLRLTASNVVRELSLQAHDNAWFSRRTLSFLMTRERTGEGLDPE